VEVSIIQGAHSREREKFANTIGYKSNANSHNGASSGKKNSAIREREKKLHIKCTKKLFA
jgi:hypothetical protein